MGSAKERNAKKKILVVDDHDFFREITKVIISRTSDMTVAAETCSEKEILNIMEKNQFDLMILDMTVSGRSGFDILRKVKTRKPYFPILLLSPYVEDIYEMSTFKNGADGYVRKGQMADELVSAMRAVMNGEKYFSHIAEAV